MSLLSDTFIDSFVQLAEYVRVLVEGLFYYRYALLLI